MNVPLFPRPPVVRGIVTPHSNVPDITTLSRAPTTPVVIIPHVYEHHVSVHSPRKRRRRNLVHPQVKNAAHRHVTEFCMRMSEHHAKDDERDDDADVICGVGKYYLNYKKSFYNCKN